MTIDKNKLIDNFIGVYDNIVPVKDCNQLIKYFETHVDKSKDVRIGENLFENKGLSRKDTAIFMNDPKSEIAASLVNYLLTAMNLYKETFFPINNVNLTGTEIKIQKTTPRGGYHVWHCESSEAATAERVLAWTVYLNDVPEDEGSTEFLWQNVKIYPKKGTVSIFPAAFTHTHRGNPVYSCDKYIATGWFVHAAQ